MAKECGADRSGWQSLGEGLPAQIAGPAHLDHHLQSRFPAAEAQERLQLGSGQHLPFQQPEQHRTYSSKLRRKQGSDPLHLTDGSPPPNALMAEMGRPHPMELGQEGFRIPEAAGRQHLGLVTGSPQSTHQAGLAAALKGHGQSDGAAALKIPSKIAAGEEKRHRFTPRRGTV
jgi:hypothetical protein